MVCNHDKFSKGIGVNATGHVCRQERNAELREEVHWHEQQRLKAWAQQEATTNNQPTAGPKPLAPLSVVSLPEDTTGLLPAAHVDKVVALPSQQVQQAPQHGAELQTVAQPPATLEEQTEAAPAAPPMTNPPCITFNLPLAEPPQQQQPLRTSQSNADTCVAHAATANTANVTAPTISTLTGGPDLNLAAILKRPQRPPAKPLPPVPRFDRCLCPHAQNS